MYVQKGRLSYESVHLAYQVTPPAIKEYLRASEKEKGDFCKWVFTPGKMVYVSVLDPQGKMVYLCTDKNREAVTADIEKQPRHALIGTQKIIGIPVLIARHHVLSNKGKLGSLEIAFSWLPLHNEFNKKMKIFFLSFGLFAAVLGVLLVYRVRTVLEPLSKFAASLKEIEAEWPLSQEEFQRRLQPEKAGPETKPVLEALRTSLVKLLEHQEALRKSEELASLGKLSAQVAHDIRSPLAALGAAAKGLEMPEDQRKLVEGAVSRMQGIADDLLQRYRAPSAAQAAAKPAACALAGLIEQVLSEKRLQHKDKTGIKIEFNSAPGEIKALVEPKELQRLLSNLVNNSLEAFDKDGTVSVSLSAVDGKVLIEVKDNGKGIPAEILAKLGQKGVTHGKAGGTGLGLYHARTSVEGWGGSFKIKSVPGKGATVLIELPCQPAPAGGLAVLLDDDSLVHMNWKLAAKAAGVELRAYKTPEDFAAATETLSKDAAIYIDSDLGKDIKGEDIAKDLREKGFTDITMATGHGSEKFSRLPWLKVTGKEPPWASGQS
ncbi:MAG: HAMP domain-containing sensor histidine kinase [Elusimicrobiales bacterium]|nr:HAMP domain-containing sensor histidine kinase [Elusimicrobiales bacterium]